MVRTSAQLAAEPRSHSHSQAVMESKEPPPLAIEDAGPSAQSMLEESRALEAKLHGDQPGDEVAPIGTSYLVGTAMVLAFIKIKDIQSTEETQRRVAAADGLLDGSLTPSGLSFRDLYMAFQVLLYENMTRQGWLDRSLVWNAYFLQSSSGSWSRSSDVATLLRCQLPPEGIEEPGHREFDEEVISKSMPQTLARILRAHNTPKNSTWLSLGDITVQRTDNHIDPEEFWTTLLVMARLEIAEEMFALPPTQTNPFQTTLIDTATKWLDAKTKQNIHLKLAMRELHASAREVVGQWQDLFHRGLQVLQQELQPKGWRSVWMNLKKAARKFVQRTLKNHKVVRLVQTRCTENCSRSERVLVLATFWLGLLGFTITFYLNRGRECCADFREGLGCDRDLDSKCMGSNPTCAQLEEFYTAPDCSVFPDPDNFGDTILLSMCAVIPMTILHTVLVIMFSCMRTSTVPQAWIRRPSTVEELAAMLKAAAAYIALHSAVLLKKLPYLRRPAAPATQEDAPPASLLAGIAGDSIWLRSSAASPNMAATADYLAKILLYPIQESVFFLVDTIAHSVYFFSAHRATLLRNRRDQVAGKVASPPNGEKAGFLQRVLETRVWLLASEEDIAEVFDKQALAEKHELLSEMRVSMCDYIGHLGVITIWFCFAYNVFLYGLDAYDHLGDEVEKQILITWAFLVLIDMFLWEWAPYLLFRLGRQLAFQVILKLQLSSLLSSFAEGEVCRWFEEFEDQESVDAMMEWKVVEERRIEAMSRFDDGFIQEYITPVQLHKDIEE